MRARLPVLFLNVAVIVAAAGGTAFLAYWAASPQTASPSRPPTQAAKPIEQNPNASVTATTPAPNAPPSCSLSVSPSTGPAPLMVTATATCTAKNNIASTVIDWNDGSSQNGSSGTHTYTNAGSYTVRVTATDSGNLTGSASQHVTATGATHVDFSLSATPPSQPGSPGTTVKYMVTVASSGGYTGTIDLHVHGLPHGATASFAPASMQNAGSSTLTVSLGKSVRTGKYHLTIIGHSQHLRRTTSVVLTTVGQQPSPLTPGAASMTTKQPRPQWGTKRD